MTTFSIDGKITSIETEPNAAITTLAGGAPPAFGGSGPVTIAPANAEVTVIIAQSSGAPVTQFQLDGSFPLGAVVEIYGTVGFELFDENGISVASGGGSTGVRARKIRTGAPGVATWGVTQ
jgi:hypothetical protein